MTSGVRTIGLGLACSFGLFALARRATRNHLRVLCYHGASFDDEHRFRPGLFMSPDTFTSRMAFLARNGYEVLTLDAALDLQRDGRLTPKSVVMTIDDGWFGTVKHMTPVLEKHGFPATLYVTTYYVEKQTAVFNVAVGYALWKAGEREYELGEILQLPGYVADLTTPSGRQKASSDIIDYGENQCDAEGRQELLRSLFKLLRLDWAIFESQRMIALASRDELQAVGSGLVDLQLHTHRHRFGGLGAADASQEIVDNREALSAKSSGNAEHFCYPSGRYSEDQFSVLSKLGVKTATTTKLGLHTMDESVFAISRILDSETVPEIVLEAYLSGFMHLLHGVRNFVTGRH